jgi:hypothetical protein
MKWRKILTGGIKMWLKGLGRFSLKCGFPITDTGHTRQLIDSVHLLSMPNW